MGYELDGCVRSASRIGLMPAHQFSAVGIPFFVPNVAIVGYCQSVERMRAALSFVFLRGIGFLIPVFLLLPVLLGTEGIWLSMPLTEILTLTVIGRVNEQVQQEVKLQQKFKELVFRG